MTEWLNQYEEVAQRQQRYLQKIRDLRQRLKSKDERCMMLSIERMRKLPYDADPMAYQKSPDYKSRVPWSSSLLAHSYYPKMSSPSPRQSMDGSEAPVASERGGCYACVISGERLLPKAHPKRLSPINSKSCRDKAERAVKSDMSLERNKTDYEPIEDIAKRNRIQFSRYLSSRDGKEEQDKNENSGEGGTRHVAPRHLSVVPNAGDVPRGAV